MKKKVVCSECGKKFDVDVVDETFNPTACIGCGKIIIKVICSPGSEDYLSIVEG